MIGGSMIIDKLRRNLKARNLTIKDLYNNTTNAIEFRNNLKKIGTSGKEID